MDSCNMKNVVLDKPNFPVSQHFILAFDKLIIELVKIPVQSDNI